MSNILNQSNIELTSLIKYKFKSEGHHRIYPQEILAMNPQVLKDLKEPD